MGMLARSGVILALSATVLVWGKDVVAQPGTPAAATNPAAMPPEGGDGPAALPDRPADATDSQGASDTIRTPQSPGTILAPNVQPIDLNTALQLAGVQNPQLMIARQRVVEAAALRQLAAVQILPSLNAGT